MKKLVCLLCSLVMIILLCVPMTASAATKKNTSKKNAKKITEAGVTQHLEKESQKRWYTFSTEKEGDALVIFDNSADTVYSYYWYMTVYKKDGKTVLKEGNVEGGGKTTRIALTNLEAGKYYIRIARSSGGNPFMIGYTDAEYTIHLITADTQRPALVTDPSDGSSAESSKVSSKAESSKADSAVQSGDGVSSAVAEKGTVFFLQEKDTLLCSLGGRLYVKENDGVCMAGYYTHTSGQTGPLLVGESEEAVKYYSTGSSEEEFEYGTLSYDGKQYFYSHAWGFLPGDFTDTLTPAIYKCSAGEKLETADAARELLNVYFGKDPKDGFEKAKAAGFFAKYWFWLVLGVIVLIVIIVKIVSAVNDKTPSYSSSSYSSYSGSSSSGSSSSGSSSSSSSYSGSSYSDSSYSGSSSSYDDYGISRPAYDYNHVTVGEQDYRVYGSGSSQYYEDAEGYRHSTEGMDVQEPFNWLDL